MLIILDKIQIKSYVHIIHNHLPHKHNVYTIAPPLSPLLVMSEKEVLGVGLGGGVSLLEEIIMVVHWRGLVWHGRAGPSGQVTSHTGSCRTCNTQNNNTVVQLTYFNFSNYHNLLIYKAHVYLFQYNKITLISHDMHLNSFIFPIRLLVVFISK